MKELKDLLGQKSKLSPVEKEAKLAAIKGMRKMAGDLMAEDAKGMKKVTVAAPDKIGLEHGLETAKDMIKPEDDLLGDESPDEEASESPEEEKQELDQILAEVDSPEEIDALMAKLAEKKAALQKA